MTDQPQRPLDPQEIEAYLLGDLPEERVAVLDTTLHDDVAALNQFAQAMQVMSLVRQEFAGQAQYQAANKQEPLLEDFNTLLKELGQQEAAAEPITLPIEQAAFQATPAIQTERMSAGEVLSLSSYVLRKAITSRPAILSAAAAIVLLATVLFFNWGGSDNGEEIVQSPTDNIVTTREAVIVATLTAEQDSQWAEGALAPGSQLHPGDRLTLTAGFAEITTEEGAVVILESPATIELLDNRNALRLHSGKLVGICETPSSKGFLVRTSHMNITDLGTRFGVDATTLDATEVHVFEGVVEVAMQVSTATKRSQTQLSAGQALRADVSRMTVIEEDRLNFTLIASSGDGVVNLGLASSGLAALTGDTAWVPGQTYIHAGPDQWARNDQMVVFEELPAYQLEEDAPVTLAAPGSIADQTKQELEQAIPAGTHVRTYVMISYPNSDGVTRTKGSVTFDGEVLGIATTHQQSKALIDMLGGSARLVKFKPNPTTWIDPSRSDWVALDEDHRTVSFSCTSQKLSGIADAVRVFVRVPMTQEGK